MIVNEKEYRITDELSRKLKMIIWLLRIMIFTFSIVFFLSIEQYNDILFAEADPATIIDGVSIAIVFILAVALGAVIISHIMTPKNIDDHIIEEL